MKVTNNNYVSKPFVPVNLYPIAAPPPCQVEVQEKTVAKPEKKQPLQSKEWRAKMLRKREMRKRRERIKRATSAKNKAQEALLLLEEKLAHQACRLVQAHAPPAQVE